MFQIWSILNPIKKAVVILEHKNATLADCFICLAIMATSIKELPQVGTNSFHSGCETIFNKRWQEFNFDLYLLAYFLAEAAAVYCMENNIKEQALTKPGSMF